MTTHPADGLAARPALLLLLLLLLPLALTTPLERLHAAVLLREQRLLLVELQPAHAGRWGRHRAGARADPTATTTTATACPRREDLLAYLLAGDVHRGLVDRPHGRDAHGGVQRGLDV